MSKLLIEEHPLQVLPSLAKEIGLNEAIMLQQIHYWIKDSKKVHDGKPWTYNSAAKWQEQFPFWSESTIRRTVNSLRKYELISVTSEYNKMPMDKTLWYTINYDVLNRLTTPSSQNDHMVWSKCTDEVVKVTRAIPETSTKTITEKNSRVNLLAEISEEYQKNWGMPNGMFLPSVEKLLEQGIEPELIKHVINLTVIRGKKWNYAAGTLARMAEDGVKTVEQAKSKNAERQKPLASQSKSERREPERKSLDDDYKMLEELGL